jgi:hypothetical protein
MIVTFLKRCRVLSNAKAKAKAKAKAATFIHGSEPHTIPCTGVLPETLKTWPTDDYRREVALHVLTLHGRDICAAERATCARYKNRTHTKSLDQDRMDRLVNTYGHEL